VRGDQAAQLARRRPSRRPAAGGTGGVSQQPPYPRRCLREVIGCGERTREVPGLQCRLGLSSGGSGGSGSSAPGVMPAGPAGATGPVSSSSGSEPPAPGASVPWRAASAAAIEELCGPARESGLSVPVASAGMFRAVQVAGDAFRSRVADGTEPPKTL
jgi:hypothetical protein